MSAIKSMMLDIRACKAYAKNFILVLIMLVLYTVTIKSVYFIMMMTFLLIIPIWHYPFIVYEKSSYLYQSLPQKKSDIVLGRYLLAACGIILASIISAAVSFLQPNLLSRGLIFFFTSVCAFFASLLISVQAPVLFKFGYMKSRIFVIILVALIGCVTGMVISLTVGFSSSGIKAFTDNASLAGNMMIPLMLFISAGIIMVISYNISLALFTKKDM